MPIPIIRKRLTLVEGRPEGSEGLGDDLRAKSQGDGVVTLGGEWAPKWQARSLVEDPPIYGWIAEGDHTSIEPGNRLVCAFYGMMGCR